MKSPIMIASLLTAACTSALATPSITLMGNSQGIHQANIGAISEIVKQVLDTSSQSPYASIKVQPIYQSHGGIKYLLAYLPAKKDYSFSITRINVNQDSNGQYVAGNVVNDYHLSNADWAQQPSGLGVCPDENVEFVAATSYPSITTAKTYTEQVYNDAKKNGYKSVLLEGNEASVENYENYLACPKLKGFYNIGHGGSTGVLLSDGMLGSGQFDQMNKELKERAVVVLNSCEVFNDPLKSAVIGGADPQKYAGGITTLRIGTSEPASACFWQHAFAGNKLSDWLNTCATQLDQYDTWGIGGSGNEVMNKPA